MNEKQSKRVLRYREAPRTTYAAACCRLRAVLGTSCSHQRQSCHLAASSRVQPCSYNLVHVGLVEKPDLTFVIDKDVKNNVRMTHRNAEDVANRSIELLPRSNNTIVHRRPGGCQARLPHVLRAQNHQQHRQALVRRVDAPAISFPARTHENVQCKDRGMARVRGICFFTIAERSCRRLQTYLIGSSRDSPEFIVIIVLT